MKKFLLISLISFSALVADIYYAKAEPLEQITVKASYGGTVVKADTLIEGSIATGASIVELDTSLDRADLLTTERKIASQSKLLATNKSVYLKRLSYFEGMKKIKSKSKTEVDNAFYAQASAHERYIATQNTFLDLIQRKKVLKKYIEEKTVSFPQWYVYKLFVKQGDVVSMGTPLVEIANTSKAKLRLFLSAEDALTHKHKKLFIDGELTPYTLDRVWKVANSEHISSYETLLYIEAPKLFSKVVKVELKKVEP